MYVKVLLKDGRSFLAKRGFWETFWSGWVETAYRVADTTFGDECKGHRIFVRNHEVLGVIHLGKKLPSVGR